MPQYLPLGTVATPATWTLPAGLELSVGSVFASFDGTSAAGAYIPTLQVISDAGATVIEVPQDASVAAGSSVVASWAPFLRSQAQASGALSGTKGIYNSATLTLGGGAAGNVTWQHQLGSSLLDLTTPTVPAVITGGVYWIGVSYTANATWNTDAALQGTIEALTTPDAKSIAYALPDALRHVPFGFVGMVWTFAAGETFRFNLVNEDSLSHGCYMQEADVVLIGTV